MSAPPRQPVPPFRLSPSQEFLWESMRFKSLGRPLLSRDNPVISLRVTGPFDVERLRAALRRMTERHESLRTTLTDLGPAPRQVVLPPADPPLSTVDLTGTPSARSRNVLAEALVASSRSGTFNLLRGPLWACLVIRMSETDHVVAFSFSHLIIDGMSVASFLRQIGDQYAGLALPPLDSQYRDFVDQAWAGFEDNEQKLDFWRSRLARPPGRVPFPTDYPPSPVLRSLRSHAFRSPLDAGQLRAICHRVSATPYIANLAAYAVLLSCAGGAREIVFSGSLARPDLKPTEDLLGCFLDFFLLPVSVDPDMTLGRLVAHVRDTFFDAQKNMVPYTRLAAATNPEFHRNRPYPGRQIYDVWTRGRIFDIPRDAILTTFGEATATLFSATTTDEHSQFTHPRQRAAYERFYLPIFYLDSVDGTSGVLKYDITIFTPETVRHIAAAQQSFVCQMASPDTRLPDAWRAVPEQDRAALVHDGKIRFDPQASGWNK